PHSRQELPERALAQQVTRRVPFGQATLGQLVERTATSSGRKNKVVRQPDAALIPRCALYRPEFCPIEVAKGRFRRVCMLTTRADNHGSTPVNTVISRCYYCLAPILGGPHLKAQHDPAELDPIPIVQIAIGRDRSVIDARCLGRRAMVLKHKSLPI